MSSWELPKSVEINGKKYAINTDYRDILEIIGYLTDPDKPAYIKWSIAIALFYKDEIPSNLMPEATEELAKFIGENEEDDGQIHPKLIDWEQDSKAIIADVNKVAGYEIRSVPYLHWWTFLSYFRGIGEGQLSTIVSIRSKKARHKKLDKWEQEFYSENRSAIDFKTHYTQEELEEQERIKKLLGE